jgi:hypothetical protein
MRASCGSALAFGWHDAVPPCILGLHLSLLDLDVLSYDSISLWSHTFLSLAEVV